MIRLVLAASGLLLSTAAVAQAPAGAPAGARPLTPSPEVSAAAQAFGQCVRGEIAKVPAAVTPEAGAATVMAACGTQRAALEERVEALLASAELDEAQRNAAREQVRAGMAQAEQGIVNGIRQMRSQGR